MNNEESNSHDTITLEQFLCLCAAIPVCLAIFVSEHIWAAIFILIAILFTIS